LAKKQEFANAHCWKNQAESKAAPMQEWTKRPAATCATGWNARAAARLQMRISMPATAIPSHWTIAAIQSGERVTFDDAKQQVMAGAHPWPRVQGRTVGCLDTTRRSKDRISAEISVCIYRLAAEICRRHG